MSVSRWSTGKCVCKQEASCDVVVVPEGAAVFADFSRDVWRAVSKSVIYEL